MIKRETRNLRSGRTHALCLRGKPWNLSQLNYFKKLAEVLHYTRAAQELFITQPTSRGYFGPLE